MCSEVCQGPPAGFEEPHTWAPHQGLPSPPPHIQSSGLTIRRSPSRAVTFS